MGKFHILCKIWEWGHGKENIFKQDVLVPFKLLHIAQYLF